MPNNYGVPAWRTMLKANSETHMVTLKCKSYILAFKCWTYIGIQYWVLQVLKYTDLN